MKDYEYESMFENEFVLDEYAAIEAPELRDKCMELSSDLKQYAKDLRSTQKDQKANLPGFRKEGPEDYRKILEEMDQFTNLMEGKGGNFTLNTALNKADKLFKLVEKYENEHKPGLLGHMSPEEEQRYNLMKQLASRCKSYKKSLHSILKRYMEDFAETRETAKKKYEKLSDTLRNATPEELMQRGFKKLNNTLATQIAIGDFLKNPENAEMLNNPNNFADKKAAEAASSAIRDDVYNFIRDRGIIKELEDAGQSSLEDMPALIKKLEEPKFVKDINKLIKESYEREMIRAQAMKEKAQKEKEKAQKEKEKAEKEKQKEMKDPEKNMQLEIPMMNR